MTIPCWQVQQQQPQPEQLVQKAVRLLLVWIMILVLQPPLTLAPPRSIRLVVASSLLQSDVPQLQQQHPPPIPPVQRSSSSLNETELDCRMRIMAIRYAQFLLQPFRWNRRQYDEQQDEFSTTTATNDDNHDDPVWQQMRDALRISQLCPDFVHSLANPTLHSSLDPAATTAAVATTSRQPSTPRHEKQRSSSSSTTTTTTAAHCPTRRCIYVDPSVVECQHGDHPPRRTGDGHRTPNATMITAVTVPNAAAAIRQSRQWNDPGRTTIVFRTGIHWITGDCGGSSGGSGVAPVVLELTERDSGLSLIGEPHAWLSGGMPLPFLNDTAFWTTAKMKIPYNDGALPSPVRVANLTQLFLEYHVPTDHRHTLVSLFGKDCRFVRARYPNANPEIDQWGYSSPKRLVYSIGADQVLEWHKPPVHGPIPQFTYVDLRQNDDDPTRPLKNDSTMAMYNVYAAGVGGVCAALWGTDAPSYWCSNASAGGWAEVDRDCAVTGRLQIPVGMTYNTSNAIGRRIQQWNDSAKGGIVHAWHSQSWAVHMFAIDTAWPDDGILRFASGGGRQGGRNWCRCDQCAYAAPWCGQHDRPVPNHADNRLISGTWFVENILAELDTPGEYYFDATVNLLYVYPNQTDDGMDHLRLAVAEQLLRVSQGASNISITNLGFRDTAATYMANWSVPSGGDWSIHHGGAMVLENVTDIVVQNCTFSRLDGNALLVSGRTRNVAIRRNVFEWIGESAIALVGTTDGFNATSGQFPMDTHIDANVMRELGIYQKQSSAVFISKAARTTIRNNLMFNIARAAINFNDMMGGGDLVERNVLFNTCRESGDHGPINSWDRQPFLTTLRDGVTPSFVPVRRRITWNLIFANYGASQGVDNDDGSSWYHLHNNVMYNADGFKMDYGGHDSIFEDNLVIGYPWKGVCVGFGSFFEGHGHVVRRNTCLSTNAVSQAIIELETCQDNHATLHDNRYYTPSGNATCRCGYTTAPIAFADYQTIYGIDRGSTLNVAPNDASAIMVWVNDVLFPEALLRSEMNAMQGIS